MAPSVPWISSIELRPSSGSPVLQQLVTTACAPPRRRSSAEAVSSTAYRAARVSVTAATSATPPNRSRRSSRERRGTVRGYRGREVNRSDLRVGQEVFDPVVGAGRSVPGREFLRPLPVAAEDREQPAAARRPHRRRRDTVRDVSRADDP